VQKLEAAPDIEAVAHRVVHGGGVFTASVLVTEEVLERLACFNSLAPLHQPHNLEGMRRFQAAFPRLPQVACFDTAFHATMPGGLRLCPAQGAAGKKACAATAFTACPTIMGMLLEHTLRGRGRVVMAHLGNGASLCAALAGSSVATTMGFSALDGLMMGTRSGSLDAGVLLYLMEQGWTHAQMEKLLYKQSGLLGVSGISADMRTLRASDSPDAERAILQFTHRVIRESGALMACLGGLDVLAFSGGIGENDAVLREQVCNRLAWTGLRIDEERNRNADGKAAYAIHAPDSRVEIWVIPTDEGRVAAREAAQLLQTLKAGGQATPSLAPASVA
jgi:acetate kinase